MPAGSMERTTLSDSGPARRVRFQLELRNAHMPTKPVKVLPMHWCAPENMNSVLLPTYICYVVSSRAVYININLSLERVSALDEGSTH